MDKWEHVTEPDGGCWMRHTVGDSVGTEACPFHQEVSFSSLLTVQPYCLYWPEDTKNADSDDDNQ